MLTRLLDAPPFAMPPLDVLPMLSCRSCVSEAAGSTAQFSEVGTARSSARSSRTSTAKWEYIPTPLSARGMAELRWEPSQVCSCAQLPNVEMGPQTAIEAQAGPHRGRAPVPPLNVRPAAKLVRRDTQLLLDAGVVRLHAPVVSQRPVSRAPHGVSAVVPPAGSSPTASSLTACLVGGLRMPSLRSAASPRRLSPRRSASPRARLKLTSRAPPTPADQIAHTTQATESTTVEASNQFSLCHSPTCISTTSNSSKAASSGRIAALHSLPHLPHVPPDP